MSSLWTQGGNLILSDDGSSIIRCDECPCQEITTVPCDVCEGGLLPECWRIDVEGFVNGSGSNANIEDMNGSFIVGEPGTTAAIVCDSIGSTCARSDAISPSTGPHTINTSGVNCSTAASGFKWAIGVRRSGTTVTITVALEKPPVAQVCLVVFRTTFQWDECFVTHNVPYLSNDFITAACIGAYPSSVQVTPVPC